MQRKITGFELDADREWTALLDCRHRQHVRHNPPWAIRQWVTTEKGRESKIGVELDCKKCDRGEPKDF